MRGAWAAVLIACALPSPPSEAQIPPSASFRKLVSSNGFSPLVFDVEARRANSFREHVFRYPQAGAETRELLYDFYFGLRSQGVSRWMTAVPIASASYLANSGIIEVVQDLGAQRLTSSYAAPFGLSMSAFVAIAELENSGAQDNDVALFSLHNFHTGGGPSGTQGESIQWDATLGAYVESSALGDAAAGGILIAPIGGLDHHQASPMNPYATVNAGQHLSDVNASGVLDDAVSGFERGTATLSAGGRLSLGVVVAYVRDRDYAAAKRAIDAWIAGRDAGGVKQAMVDEWQSWFAAGLLPEAASPAEAKVAAQALVTLRMAASHEPGAPAGQLVASIAPGHWDITWVRDATYAIRALIETHHFEEAERALDFLIRGPMGGQQLRVGRDYGLSICRYYGDGREETDLNQNGPNVELDGFGLFLEVASLYARSGPAGAAWLAQKEAAIGSGVADVLLDTADPETHLVEPESSIWESHWDNGGRQRWVFTSGAAVIGLLRFADALEAVVHRANDPRPARYRARAIEIRAAMAAALVDPISGSLAASVEQLRRGSAFADAQAALILDPRTFSSSSAVGLHTLDFLRQNLFLGSTTGHGYRRNDDGDVYDRREWLVVDLGIAKALRIAGRAGEADAILSWITDQAALNFNLIPELFDENDGRYQGETPMVGFGAGAYLSTLIARNPLAPPAPDAGVLDAASPLDAGAGGDADPGIDDAADQVDAGGGHDAGASRDAVSADRGTPSSAAPAGCGCSETDRSGAQALMLLGLGLGLATARTSRARRPAPRPPR
ncbi:MAG: hypothetical protein U1E65_09020 [Myxococcota bacterium]